MGQLRFCEMLLFNEMHFFHKIFLFFRKTCGVVWRKWHGKCCSALLKYLSLYSFPWNKTKSEILTEKSLRLASHYYIWHTGTAKFLITVNTSHLWLGPTWRWRTPAECEASPCLSRHKHGSVIDCTGSVCANVCKKTESMDGQESCFCLCVRDRNRKEGGDRRLWSRLAEGDGRAGDGDAEWQKCFACPSNMSWWQEEWAQAWGHVDTHTHMKTHTHMLQKQRLSRPHLQKLSDICSHLAARCVTHNPLIVNEVWPTLVQKTHLLSRFYPQVLGAIMTHNQPC